MSELLDARRFYTEKEWPELPSIPQKQRQEWLTLRAEEQRKDGRQ